MPKDTKAKYNADLDGVIYYYQKILQDNTKNSVADDLIFKVFFFCARGQCVKRFMCWRLSGFDIHK